MSALHWIAALLASAALLPAAEWKPVPGHLLTRWSAAVDPQNPLPEYPRPQLQRPTWTNLNGLWDYAVLPLEAEAPLAFDGKILVPYPVESALSGVKKPLRKDQRLWYRRSFQAPATPPDIASSSTSAPSTGKPASPSTATSAAPTAAATTPSPSTSPTPSSPGPTTP